MSANHENEDYLSPEQQHREYLYELLDQRRVNLQARNRLNEWEMSELAQIEDLLNCYRIEVEHQL